MKMRRQALVVVKALLKALRHYLVTIVLVSIVGWFAYRKIDGVWLFMAGALAGYIQSFFETFIKNYSELKKIELKRSELRKTFAAEVDRPILVSSQGEPEQRPNPFAKNTGTSLIPGLQRAIWVVLKSIALAALSLFILWVGFNILLIIYDWYR